MISFVSLLLKGMVIGIANIIPGVSGGTMALLLGIYERLIRALGRYRLESLRELRNAMRGQGRRGKLLDLSREHDLWFLVLIAAGAFAAVVLTSSLMKYLLEEHHAATYGFFFGLVAVSVAVPCAHLRRRSWKELLSAIVALALTVALILLFENHHETEQPATGPDHSPGHLLYLFAIGAVAISAMILPGVSGSFILLLFGVYYDILAAIDAWDALTLGVFALGCLLGISLFVRLLSFLLERYYSPTMAFLAGLMLGSLWKLEKEAHVGLESETSYPTELVTIATAVLGAALALGVLLYERRSQARKSQIPNPKSQTNPKSQIPTRRS